MDVKTTIRFDEIKHKVLVKNPGNRKVMIPQEENGLVDGQLFVSEDLPDEILFQFIGLVKFANGTFYPKYKSEYVTRKALWISGTPSYISGIEVFDKLCRELIWQEGMLEVRGIRKSDLEAFDYKDEELSYWLSSPTIYGNENDMCFGPGNVINGNIDYGYKSIILRNGQFISGGLAVRPVIILDTKVVEIPKIKQVSF